MKGDRVDLIAVRDVRPVVPRYLRYAGAVACAVVILYASLVDPGDGDPSTLFGVPLTVYLHLLAYAGLTAALAHAMLAVDGRALLVAVALATAYGGAIEVLQGLVPRRTMEGTDALANAIGATAGALLWNRLAPWFGARPSDPPPGGESR